MPLINPSPIKTWLAENLLTLTSMVLALIAGAIYLKADVKVNAQEILENKIRIEKLQDAVAEYPSERFFNEKFKNTDDSINDLEEAVKELQKATVL